MQFWLIDYFIGTFSRLFKISAIGKLHREIAGTAFGTKRPPIPLGGGRLPAP
jgi:hypothetical protein